MSLSSSFSLRPSSFFFVHDVFSRIAPGYDLMNTLMSLSLDHHWRKQGAQFIPWFSFYDKNNHQQGNLSFSLGEGACGTGDMFGALLPFLLELYKDYGYQKNFFSFCLMDPNETMLSYGGKKIFSWFYPQTYSFNNFFSFFSKNDKNSKNVTDLLLHLHGLLQVYRSPSLGGLHQHHIRALYNSISYKPWALEDFPLAESSFDLFTLAFGLRNVAPSQRSGALCRVFSSLKPGGWLWIMDFVPPSSTSFPLGYETYLSLMPSLGRWVLQDSKAYDYLAQSIAEFLDPDEIMSLLEKTGFSSLKTMALFPGVLRVYRGQKK